MLSFWGFSDLLTELSDWGPIFTLWSNSEENLNGALSAMAKSVEKCYVGLQELVCVQIEFLFDAESSVYPCCFLREFYHI